jgi:uncharacterized protein YndB with AHSA1/START domain
VLEAEPPRLLVLEDGFADKAGEPNAAMSTSVTRIDITDRPGGVTMTLATRFPSLEAMEKLMGMGMEGLKQALARSARYSWALPPREDPTLARRDSGPGPVSNMAIP